MFDSRLIALQTERILLRLPPFNHLPVDITTGGGGHGGGGGSSDITDLVYTLSDADNGKTLNFVQLSAQVVVAPLTLTTGFACSCKRGSTGMLHIFPRSGLTVSSAFGYRVDTAGTATLSLSGTTLTIGGNITTDLVDCGGFVPGSFSNDNALASVTAIDDLRLNAVSVVASRIRNDGFIRGVKFMPHGTNELVDWDWRVFRPNGSNFDFVGKTEQFAVAAAGIGTVVTKRFTTPVACIGSDIPGYYTGNALNSLAVTTGNADKTVRFVGSDVQTPNTFPTVLNFLLNHQVLAWSPLLGLTGDSIMGGSHTASTFVPYQQGGPSGLATSQIQYQLRASLGPNIEYVNQARAAMTFDWTRSTGVPAAIAAKGAWIWIHCGINDIATGRTWPDVEADLDAIKALLVNGERLIIDEILPWTAGNTDDYAIAVRTFNLNLAIWCADNDATLILCHDAMGQIRPATGHLDDLKTAYAMPDGTHLTAAGRDEMATLWEAQIGLT